MRGIELSDPERALALNFVPKTCRRAVLSLWQLDETLGRIVASTTEPLIGQMRLTWWHERLTALDFGVRTAEPLLGKLEDVVLSHDVNGAALAVLIEGWEAVLDPLPLSVSALKVFAQKRGGTLFRLSADILGATGDVTGGEQWGAVDFAAHCSDRATVERAILVALECPGSGQGTPKPLRILARLARAKLGRSDTSISTPLNRFDFLRAMLR